MRGRMRRLGNRNHAKAGPPLFYQPVGLEGNRLQKRLPGSYFSAFSTNRITIGLQNLHSTGHFFNAILKARQTAGAFI
jgi:hypothetical protein